MFFRIFIFSVLALSLHSCNSYKIANRHVMRKLEKNGLAAHTADLERYTINYWDSGNDKPVLILLHGFGASGQFHWYRQVEELKNYRVILPDLLYFGGSIPKSSAYSLVDQVKAMQALIKHLDIKEFFLCGVSYGGLVASELALAESNKVKKLIILDAPVKFITKEDTQPVFQQYNISQPSDLLVPKDYKMLKNLMRIAYRHPPKVPDMLFKDMHKHLYIRQAENQKILLKRLESERGYYESQQYRFKFPVLLIWGEYDELVPKHIGADLQKHIGENSKLEIIPDTAHLPNVEAPEKFNKLLLDFLKE